MEQPIRGFLSGFNGFAGMGDLTKSLDFVNSYAGQSIPIQWKMILRWNIFNHLGSVGMIDRFFAIQWDFSRI